jgi:3-methyl-2-oxobutanoate hydroxymethyltransferase
VSARENRVAPPKRVVTMTGAYQRRNYTVFDLVKGKGAGQKVQTMAFSADEAAAAGAAGLDMINIRWNAQRPEEACALRRAAPETFMTFCMPPTLAASKAEALRAAFTAMEAGADSIYCAWSLKFVEELASAGVPVMGHIGLIPRKSTWTGGLCAVGKTLEQAKTLHNDLKALENAGAWAVECEVIPHNVMALLARNTGLVTISLGSGSDCDVQHLFAEDILGMSQEPVPRHTKRYRNLFDEYQRLQRERIAAFEEFADDVRSGAFPQAGQLVQADRHVVSELEVLIAKDMKHAPLQRR